MGHRLRATETVGGWQLRTQASQPLAVRLWPWRWLRARGLTALCWWPGRFPSSWSTAGTAGSPSRPSRDRRPALVVQRVAALEEDPVDAARHAEHFAAGVVDPPPVQLRFGFWLTLPVIEPAADREGQRGRRVDEDVPPVAGSPARSPATRR